MIIFFMKTVSVDIIIAFDIANNNLATIFDKEIKRNWT